MEKGNRSTSSRLGEIPPYDNNSDVGLGLKMQQEQGATSDANCSYPSKRAMVSPHFLPFQQHPHHHLGGSAYCSGGGGGGGGLGSVDGGSHFLNSANNQLFDAALPPGAGGPFTASQWHELERQNLIFKYLTLYNSVPAHLLSPFSRNPASQTSSGIDFKFSSGTDPEPWRCRRTDGKKWRCTRDVAPDQKYCERHAHKTRPRSRKHVEIQSHNLNNNPTPKFTHQIDPPILHNPFSTSSKKASASTYDQTRSIEWLMKGGSSPSTISQVSNVEQKQKQQQNQPSRMGFSDGSSQFYKSSTVFQQQENDQEKQDSIHLCEPYMGNDYYPYFDLKVINSLSQGSPTRHFTDAWPLDQIGNDKGPFSISSGSRELPLSSLTLSMSGGDTVVAENDPECKRSQWMMSNVSWLNSTGGPLGEALCLGNAGTRKRTPDLPSPYGRSNSSNTTSSCSKGSCEEGNHQFNFIG